MSLLDLLTVYKGPIDVYLRFKDELIEWTSYKAKTYTSLYRVVLIELRDDLLYVEVV